MPARSARKHQALSPEDKFEMLNFFEQGDHQHLRAILIALTVDPKLGPCVLNVMKRDVLPYMETNVASIRMIHKVKRLAALWGIEGDFSEPGRTDYQKPKRSLDDAPWWTKAYSDPRSFIDPDDTKASVSSTPPSPTVPDISFNRFFDWIARENPHISTPRTTKKRKIRESTTHAENETATPGKPLKQTTSTPLSTRSGNNQTTGQPVKRPTIRIAARKENERVVPVEAVARRILERSPASDTTLETSLFVLDDSTAHNEQPSRPENPVASVLAQRSDNKLTPKPAASKPKNVAVKKSTPSPVTERRSSLRPRAIRLTNS